MSSITKAAARPVSTIRNASAWSLAARMLRLSPFCAPISVICLMLVVPDVDTTVLPLRSSTVSRARGSEEHTSELQSLRHLVCRLLLEKKKKKNINNHAYQNETNTEYI